MNDRALLIFKIMHNISKQYSGDKCISLMQKVLGNIQSETCYDEMESNNMDVLVDDRDIESTTPGKSIVSMDAQQIYNANDLFIRSRIVLKRIELSCDKGTVIRLSAEEKDLKFKLELFGDMSTSAKMRIISERIKEYPFDIEREKDIDLDADGCNDLHYAVLSNKGQYVLREIILRNPEFLTQRNHSGYTPETLYQLLYNKNLKETIN